jgi:miniconductance mechanosensitive channel
MVRQLPPTEHGLPIEVYLFSAEQRWVQYEGIQADIFDHIFAVIPHFDLRVYQQPSGSDFQALGKSGTGSV